MDINLPVIEITMMKWNLNSDYTLSEEQTKSDIQQHKRAHPKIAPKTMIWCGLTNVNHRIIHIS